MSVSTRSSKAQMYSEIERLRQLADFRGQQIAAMQLELEDLRSQAPRGRAPGNAMFEAAKKLAIQYGCAARCRGNVLELYSRKRGMWVEVPAERIPATEAAA